MARTEGAKDKKKRKVYSKGKMREQMRWVKGMGLLNEREYADYFPRKARRLSN